MRTSNVLLWSLLLVVTGGSVAALAQDATPGAETAKSEADAPDDSAGEGEAPAGGDAPGSEEKGGEGPGDDSSSLETSGSDSFKSDESTADDAGDDAAEDGGDVASEETVPKPAVSSAVAQEDRTWADRTIDDGIDRLKRPVDRILERTLGSASRPVGFDWRKSWFMLGVTGSELIERNNYGSFRLGIMGRKAFGDFVVEGAVNNVTVITTPSSRALALTPYLQAGRKERFEIDANVSYPVAEGVVTPLVDVFPPMEMVLQATAAGRYLIYPRAIAGNRDWGDIDTYTNTQTWIDLGGSLASPTLTELDQEVLDPYVPAGMLQDPARLQVLVGATFDVYMQPGLFLTTRALVALPVLAAATNTQLGFWPELSVSLGYAF